MPDVQWFLLVAIAYALGSVSTGYYLVKFRTGQDIRLLGSGSTGARNVSRTLGTLGFTATLVGDAAKGAIAVGLAAVAGLDERGLIVVTVAVFAGHVWPVQLQFRGGKGLATVMGAVLVLDYWVVIATLLVAAIALAATKRFTASGLFAVALAPVLAAATERSSTDVIIGLSAVVALIFFAHRQNIASAFERPGHRQ
jgi:acyl phosphate:glycerol-3-phosphate acyltransferase